MLTDAYAELGPPEAGQPVCHNVHLLVTDIDETVDRARAAGARVAEEPTDHRWEGTGVIVDPLGHRWMLNQPPYGDQSPTVSH